MNMELRHQDCAWGAAVKVTLKLLQVYRSFTKRDFAAAWQLYVLDNLHADFRDRLLEMMARDDAYVPQMVEAVTAEFDAEIKI